MTTETKTGTSEVIEQRIIEAFVSFGVEPGVVQRDATLEDLEIDSLDLVELGQIIDEEFKIKLEARDFEGVVTVGDAMDRVIKRA
jgi:acyl carrier protein